MSMRRTVLGGAFVVLAGLGLSGCVAPGADPYYYDSGVVYESSPYYYGGGPYVYGSSYYVGSRYRSGYRGGYRGGHAWSGRRGGGQHVNWGGGRHGGAVSSGGGRRGSVNQGGSRGMGSWRGVPVPQR